MARHALAGQSPPDSLIIDVEALLAAYYEQTPDPGTAAHRVSFGTSGHRGSAFDSTFNEAHIIAIADAVRRYRAGQGIDGPLFLGIGPSKRRALRKDLGALGAEARKELQRIAEIEVEGKGLSVLAGELQMETSGFRLPPVTDLEAPTKVPDPV